MSLIVGVVGDVHRVGDPTRSASWHGAFDFASVEARLRRALAIFEAEGVDLVALLGDLAHDGDAASLEAVFEIVAAGWTGPVALVYGNHDVRLLDRGRLDEIARAALRRVVLPGASTTLDGFDLAGVAVDRGADAEPVLATAPPRSTLPSVLVSHYPLLSESALFAREGLAYSGDLPGLERAAGDLEASATPTVVLSGHLHARTAQARGSLLQLGAGSLVEAPYECGVVKLARLDGGLVAVRREVVPTAPEAAGPALAPASAEWRFDGAAWRRA